MLLSFILIARIISVEEYGEVGIIRNTISTFAVVSVMSFGVTATKYLAIYKDDNVVRAERILTFTRILVLVSSIFISILIFIFSDYISDNLLNNASLSNDVKLSSFTIFFTALNGYQNGLLAGLERFKEISFINILNGILTFPVLILLASFWKVQGVVIGMFLISLLTWIMSDYYVRLSMKNKHLRYRFENFSKDYKIIKHFTLPSFLSGLTIAPVILVVNAILTYQDDGYYQLGVFNAAYFFSIITITLNSVIGQVVYPFAMQQFNKNNKKFEYFNIISPWAIGIILNLPLIVFPEMVVKIFGSQYDTEDFKISIILIALFTIIISHRQGIARNFAAANLMWWSVFSNCFWAFVLVLTTSFLAVYGSIGLAFSFFIAYLLNTLIFVPLYIKKRLVDKKLLLTKLTIIIWLFIILSPCLYFYIESLIVRFFIFMIVFTLIGLLFNKVWKEYEK